MAISEIVKYNNKLNMISFKKFNKLDSDIFFSILARLKEKGTEKVTLSFAELTEYMPKNISNKEILAILDTSTNKLASSIIRYETQSEITKFAIFQLFTIDRKNFYITVQIAEPFLFLLNNLETGFTAFELAEFSSLSSKYTQTLYRLLKQFNRTGYRVMEWGEFLEIMDIPSSYNMGTIDMRVINPSIKELSQEPNLFNQTSPIFKGLKYKKIRGNGRGRPVEKIEFYFMPETDEAREQRQNERSLETIAQDIRQEQMLKQIRKFKMQSKEQEPPKINPITGKEVDELYAYIGRHFSIKNKFDGGYDSCKICNLYQDSDGRIYGDAINQETGKSFEFKSGFDNIEHLKNALLLENA